MCDAPILCIISRSKKRLFHTISTNFNTPHYRPTKKPKITQFTNR